MFCTNCGNAINKDSKFCTSCGKQIVNNGGVTTRAQAAPAQVINSTTYDSNLSSCQTCGVYAPVKYVEFYQNIGMLFRREQKSIKGNLCKNCINQYFTKFTLTNLFLGWWGTISFFATAFFMVNNIFRYITTLNLKKPNT